jgi:hypothetical protein
VTDDEVLFDEPGSSWWPVLWGPVFALIGAGVEALGGRVHTIAWMVVGVGLAGFTLLWVRARRRLLSVRLTPSTLAQGQESLAVHRISAVEDGDPPPRARVLGGAWTVPRKFTEIPLRLDDGTMVLAWARDGDGLRAALRDAVSG